MRGWWMAAMAVVWACGPAQVVPAPERADQEPASGALKEASEALRVAVRQAVLGGEGTWKGRPLAAAGGLPDGLEPELGQVMAVRWRAQLVAEVPGRSDATHEVGVAAWVVPEGRFLAGAWTGRTASTSWAPTGAEARELAEVAAWVPTAQGWYRSPTAAQCARWMGDACWQHGFYRRPPPLTPAQRAAFPGDRRQVRQVAVTAVELIWRQRAAQFELRVVTGERGWEVSGRRLTDWETVPPGEAAPTDLADSRWSAWCARVWGRAADGAGPREDRRCVRQVVADAHEVDVAELETSLLGDESDVFIPYSAWMSLARLRRMKAQAEAVCVGRSGDLACQQGDRLFTLAVSRRLEHWDVVRNLSLGDDICQILAEDPDEPWSPVWGEDGEDIEGWQYQARSLMVLEAAVLARMGLEPVAPEWKRMLKSVPDSEAPEAACLPLDRQAWGPDHWPRVPNERDRFLLRILHAEWAWRAETGWRTGLPAGG